MNNLEVFNKYFKDSWYNKCLSEGGFLEEDSYPKPKHLSDIILNIDNVASLGCQGKIGYSLFAVPKKFLRFSFLKSDYGLKDAIFYSYHLSLIIYFLKRKIGWPLRRLWKSYTFKKSEISLGNECSCGCSHESSIDLSKYEEGYGD
jgi:hypothetical protein